MEMPKSLSYFYYNTQIHKIPMLFFKIVKDKKTTLIKVVKRDMSIKKVINSITSNKIEQRNIIHITNFNYSVKNPWSIKKLLELNFCCCCS